MINLIEHLWQLEIPRSKITPSIIKITNQTPKIYFYSEKQSKVLRKKQHTVQTCINYLKQFSKKNEQYLLLRIQKNKHVMPSLILLNEISALLEKEDECLAVLSIDWQSKIQKIYLCECNFIENTFKAKILTYKAHEIWHPVYNMAQIQNNSKIIEECLKMSTTLLLKLKISKKCTAFNVIVGSGSSSNEIFWLWCNTFRWSQQIFYQINFDFQEIKFETQSILYKRKEFFTSKNQSKNKSQSPIKLQTKYSQSQFSNKKIQINEKVTNLLITQMERCLGCQNSTDRTKVKQVAFEDIIALRRHKKLSIKGITDQFAPVCHVCYTLLEELESMA